MKVFIVKSSDIYQFYMRKFINYAYAYELLRFLQDSDDMVFIGNYPTLYDMTNFVNEFVNYQQKKDDDILAHYFVLEPAKTTKLVTYIDDTDGQIILDYKKIYNTLISAIRKRAKNEDFYTNSVQIIEQNSKADTLESIAARIGKKNMLYFKPH